VSINQEWASEFPKYENSKDFRDNATFGYINANDLMYLNSSFIYNVYTESPAFVVNAINHGKNMVYSKIDGVYDVDYEFSKRGSDRNGSCVNFVSIHTCCLLAGTSDTMKKNIKHLEEMANSILCDIQKWSRSLPLRVQEEGVRSGIYTARSQSIKNSY
jgi:hypothetical protein